jgi:hypothetical protein
MEDITETGKWVARDGSCINYGSIDPDQDFWDPDGNKLIDPDKEDPDSENEEYTGNEGESAEPAWCRPLCASSAAPCAALVAQCACKKWSQGAPLSPSSSGMML